MKHVGILIIALCVTCFDAMAQSRTSSVLSGQVIDQNNQPLTGATVVVSSDSLIGGPRIVHTDESGRFRFLELRPGIYHLTVRLSGFKTVEIERIRISVGLLTEVPVKMTILTGEESIIVLGESPAIDPSSSTVTTILSDQFLHNIPSDRETSHILNFAPGINLESAYGGAEESGIAYQMDGVDISDPQGGSPWALFNYSLIEQVELVGLGAPAEYGQFTGVVFNTITKSGSNEFSGNAEVFYTNDAWNTSHPDSDDLVATIDSISEQTIQFAGPIRKDRLWYFVSAQYVQGSFSEGGPAEKEKDPRVFGKLTYRVNQNNTVDGWLEWAHTKITGANGDAFTPLIATNQEDNPEIVGNLSWKSLLGKNASLNVAWGGFHGHHNIIPQNGFDIAGHVDAFTGIASQNAAQFGIQDRSRNQINASLTYHASNWIRGHHDFKFGTEIERSVVRDRFGPPGGAFFSDNEGPELDPSTGREDFFTLAAIGGGLDARGTNQRLSIYAQDSWHLTDRFTLNPGVRFDINRGSVAEETVFRTNPVALRLGFALDLTGNGASILRSHYGRYYEALYASFYYYLQPDAFFPLTIQRVFHRSGFTDVLSSSQGQQYAIDPEIEHPYLDQFIISFDQQLPFGIALGSTFVHRDNVNLIETISRDGIFVPVTGIVPGTGQEITLFEHQNSGTDILIYTNPPELERTYRGLMLTANRRMNENWQLFTSYVYSRSRGNTDNLGFDENGLGANTPFFDGKFLDTPNSLVNAQGRLTHDQTHQFKLQGTWIFPALHLSLSTAYTYHSGDTWTPRTDCLLTDEGNGVIGDGILDCHEFPQGPFLYFAEPRGSRRLPARNEIDLHVEWGRSISDHFTVGLFADIFNLNNQKRVTEVETTVEDEPGQPATLNFPRSIRFGVNLEW